MDPLSAAGLGLGAASLAFQLFSGCIRGYQMFLDMANMPQELEHIRIRMRLEQARLLNWGGEIGLLKDVLEEPSLLLRLHRNLIFDILFEISRLLKASVKIEAKSGTLALAASNTVHQLPAPSPPTINAKPRYAEIFFQKAERILRKSRELTIRLDWAMVKQDAFETLVEQLISYNDSIVSLLDQSGFQQVKNMQMQSQLTLLQLSTKMDDLRSLMQAVQIQTPNRSSSSVLLALLNGVGEDLPNNPAIEQLIAFKTARLDIEQDSDHIVVTPINRRAVTIVGTYSNTDTGLYQGQNVWIEWKESDLKHPNPWWKSIIDKRVQKLVSLLSLGNTPRQFSIAKCLGYFEEADDEDDIVQYGLVFETPGDHLQPPVPRSLHYLIGHQPMPSLTERVRLATVLSSSLMYLHSVNWLHKCIRSENIIFFTQQTEAIDYHSPTLAGFEYARPDLPEELTDKPRSILEHDIYRHPDSLTSVKTRSHKGWDIYSLGIVLIEIALWKSIPHIMEIDFQHSKARSNIRRIKERLLNEDQFMSSISNQCGNRYRNAVRKCIGDWPEAERQANDDTLDFDSDVETLRKFSHEVVDVLKSIQT